MDENLKNRLTEIEKRLNKTDNTLQEIGGIMKEVARILSTNTTTGESFGTKLVGMDQNLLTLESKLTAELRNIEHKMPDSCLESFDIRLLKLAESKKIIDMRAESVQKQSTVVEICKQILPDLTKTRKPLHSCRQAPAGISGTYTIQLNTNSTPFEVFCEQRKFEGGWIVIQHRFNGAVDFYRNWTEYRDGFGDLEGEFWLGLEHVHQLTKNRPHQLVVEFRDFHDNYGNVTYGEFEIQSEADSYRVKKIGKFTGPATSDNFITYRGRKFTTFDRNNDAFDMDCAVLRHGAWWYEGCTNQNLNGRYQNTTNDPSSMTWFGLKNDFRGLSFSRIMIRDNID
ncbi:ficolin-3-like [Anopheles ziemanni]|uniref:ficolin-3-like n=1 Tax=Anopheles coustani TaxID=139045 RepID=UPI002659B092|nr:ficolin-3-like [Anopheles coustani]XP_058177343.1 ficolin-3-like [Anopheles ziemanni]